MGIISMKGKVNICYSIIIPLSPGSGGIISKKLKVYFSKIVSLIPRPKICDLYILNYSKF